jgi:ABC-type multidrug transport system fused ATPase/permease subunit
MGLHPQDTAGPLARLFLTWTIPLFRRGARAPLAATDLPPLPASASTALGHASLAALRAARPREPLVRTLLRLVRAPLLSSGAAQLVYLGALLANPLLLRLLVGALSAGDAGAATGAAVALGAAALAAALANAHSQLEATRMAHTLRTASIMAVFRAALAQPRATVALRAPAAAAAGAGAGAGGGDACAPARPRPDPKALLASDAERFLTALPLLHNAWAAPLLIAVSTYFLISFLGAPAALAGVAMLLATLPITAGITSASARAQAAQAAAADARVRETADALAGIASLKLGAGEAALAARLGAAREVEMRAVGAGHALLAASTAVAISTPVVAMVAMFASFTASGRVHDAANTFAALAFLNIVRFPLQNLGTLFSSLSQLLVGVRRIEAFLAREEGEEEEEEGGRGGVEVVGGEAEKGGGAPAPAGAIAAAGAAAAGAVISLSSATFVWPRAEGAAGGADSLSQLVLGPLTLSLARGELLVVLGPVGAGKSSALLALLGEMPRGLARGERAPGPPHGAAGLARAGAGARVGFAPQTPWLLNGSLRENVLFGAPFDGRTYASVLRACALWPDVAAFGGARDLAVIGERGVTLSGGQRARVGLARAAYALLAPAAAADAADGDAGGAGAPRVLLADDALAALDAVTGAAVWRRLLGPRGLLAAAGVARVVVTHARAPLAAATTALVLVDGKAAFCGPPAALAAAARREGAPAFLAALGAAEAGGAAAAAGEGEGDDEDAAAAAGIDETPAAGAAAGAAEAEDRATGSVPLAVFVAWMREGGRGALIGAALALAFALERASYVGADVWLASWVAAASPLSPRAGLAALAGASGDAGGGIPASLSFWLPGYAALGALNVVGSFGRMHLTAAFATGASARLFDRALWAVLRSPMRFFDATPLGRVLSRLSFDVDVLDSKMLGPVSGAFASTAWLASAVAVMLAVVPWSAAALGPMIVAYAFFNAWVRPTLRELQRLDSTSRSPLAATVAESIRGAPLLRAHAGAVARAVAAADAQLDANAAAVLCFQDSSRAMALVLDVGGAALTCVVALLGVAAGGALPPALVGLAVSWSNNFCISLNFNIVYTTGAESAAIAVERLLAYTLLPPEAPLVGPPPPPPACSGGGGASGAPAATTAARARAEVAAALAAPRGDWPREGSGVVFEGVSARYAPHLPLALSGLTFSVPPGAFCAVVGRSGSGKSTLAAALFRVLELERGAIRVGGDDVCALGLARVRGARAVIIPQEPAVARGSLRANVDGGGARSDGAVWAALGAVGLDALFSARSGAASIAAALAAPLDPATLSVGQRQLLCLARALLREPRVLVLDEATASVDAASDEKIMACVHAARAARGMTVLCIAHRLDAAARADLVLVVDGGRAAEFGPPAELLARKGGAFARLVAAAGPGAAKSFAQWL